jgi:two-component system, LytTR family, sensor kinase
MGIKGPRRAQSSLRSAGYTIVTMAQGWVANAGIPAVDVGGDTRPGRRWLEGRLGLLVGWVVATLLYAVLLMEQRQIPFRLSLALSSLRFGVLAVLGVAIWRFCARLLAHEPSRLRLTVGHAGMALGALFAWMAIYLSLSAQLYGQTLMERLASIPPLQYLEFGLTYTLLICGIVVIQLSRRLDAQRRDAAELLALAREAELRALKAQIRPHFLFNVLNSIYSLIGSRPEQAREMVELVADLMRRTLDASEEQLVPVEWEMQVMDRYLRIEKVRLGSRLDVRLETRNVPAGAMMSPLLLQPLVENAVKHGIGSRPGPGTIEVQANGIQEGLEFIVRDTGPGVVGRAPELAGHGLGLTRRRLEALFGSAFSLDLLNLEPHGLEVRLRIPLQQVSAGAVRALATGAR